MKVKKNRQSDILYSVISTHIAVEFALARSMYWATVTLTRRMQCQNAVDIG